jgi:hypothetical protein
MNLEAAYARLCTQAAATQRVMRSIRDDALSRLQELKKQDQRRQELGQPVDYAVSLQNMSFRTAIDGKHFFYDFQSHSIADEIEHIVRRTNRQYQWLLAEAYEHFEDFMEHCYAAAALADRSNWPLRDYGEIRADELASVSFERLLSHARAKKDKPQSLLNPLRRRIVMLQQFEQSTATDRNYWFFLHLIEQLRHHIVHTRGQVHSRDDFSRKVLEKCGLFNNGQPEAIYTEWIETYVQPDGDSFSIDLLERRAAPIGPMSVYHSIFDELFDALLAYAHLVASSFIRLDSVKHTAS